MSHSSSPACVPGTVISKVVAIEEVAPKHYRVRAHAPSLARQARAGQFVHVLCRDAALRDPLLRRAFSIMTVIEEDIEFLFRVEGLGTAWLAGLNIGDSVDLLGPLGIGFDFSPIQAGSRVALVGGGVGVPPMISIAHELFGGNVSELQAFVGARTKSDLIGLEDYEALKIPVSVTTDDGSAGHHGRITEPLAEWLTVSRETADVNTIVYACGPWPMLRAVARLCAEQGIKCQVSLEENMPCGIGICNGCVVQMKEPATPEESDTTTGHQSIGNEWSPYEKYRRICVEGPAVWADEIEWEVG